MKNTLKKHYKKAVLELSNGERMHGRLIGADAIASGEMVFTTAMNAYGEAMADPSYLGQILVFSYSLIGNYGIPSLKEGDFFMPPGYESNTVKAQGIIVSDNFDGCYHYERGENLEAWLRTSGVPGIAGVDTRRLVQMVRSAKKPLFGRIVPEDKTAKYDNNRFAFLQHFTPKDYVDPAKYNLLPSLSVTKPQKFGKGRRKIALVDLGVKRNIIDLFVKEGCTVEALPWNADLTQIKADAVVLTNGPGDPKNTGPLVANVAKVLKGSLPVLGIGLGYQVLALAAGAKTRRMAAGHRGANQPVFETKTRRGFMTAQNHSYEVLAKTLPPGWEPWFQNANDGALEGVKHSKKPLMGVQFTPHATQATDTTAWIIKDFLRSVK